MHAKDDVKFNQLQLRILLLFVLLVEVTVPGPFSKFSKDKFPLDSVALKGNNIVFTSCSDIKKTIFWKHKPVGSRSTKDINDLFGLVDGFRSGRFNVTSGNSTGCYSLVIKNVTLGDEGTYSCTDEAGLGDSKTWELIILDSFDCQETNGKAEYMGENNFGLPQDVISTECVSKYFGNVPSKQIISCEWSSGIELHDTYHRVTETLLTLTMMPARREFNGDQLTCYVKTEGDSNDRQIQTEWKSPHLIINYATFHQNGVLQCTAEQLSLDCHPLCNYTAIHLSNGSTYCEIAYPRSTLRKILLLQDNGLQGQSNTCTCMNSSTPKSTETPSSVVMISAAVSTGVTCICIVVAFLICCVWKGRCATTTRGNNTNSTEMRPFAPENGGGGNTARENGGSGNTVTTNSESPSGQQRTTENGDNGKENAKLLKEGDTRKRKMMSPDSRSFSI